MTSTGPHHSPDNDPGLFRRATRRMRIAITVAAVTSIALISVLAVVLLRDSGSEQGTAPQPSASATPSASPSPAPTTSEPTPAPTPAPTPTRTPSPTVRPFVYQPLWPFSSAAAAAAWQRSYRASGHQPWHLDAEQTALSFTTGYLGFTEVDRVVSRSISGDQARIGVGYQAEGRASVAAILHLVKLGQGLDAPWEVVGTIDSTFTLDRPRYGAKVTSPLTVGGRITGVDGPIRVDVRQPSSAQPIGTFCCVPAGGERQPWSARVSFAGAADPALTIVVSTGGHLQGVERFAITGVRPTSAN